MTKLANNQPIPKTIHRITPRDSVIDCGHDGATLIRRDGRGICTEFGVLDWHKGKMRTRVYKLD